MTRNVDELPSLSQMIEDAMRPLNESEGMPAPDIVRTCSRIPKPVLDEITMVARSNGMSVSLLVNLLLDSYLRGEGRPGYAELAPWYPGYALRRKG